MLSESRARFEDQNPRRQRDDDDSDEDSDELVEAGDAEASDDQPEREERQDRGERFSRRNNRPRRGEGEERSERRSARDDPQEQHVNGETIPFDALPPAIGRDDGETETSAEDEPRKPRRRSRAARSTDGDEEVAPAA